MVRKPVEWVKGEREGMTVAVTSAAVVIAARVAVEVVEAVTSTADAVVVASAAKPRK